MNEHSGPVYEVTLSIDRAVADDVDEWLAGHIDEMLAVPGMLRAKTYALEDDEERVHRVSCYFFESDAHLQRYLDGPAAELRQATHDRFGDRFEATRRVLRSPDAVDQAPNRITRCLNCDAVLTGQYCGNCGQRARSRLISTWELVRDAFGDLLELDSRLWRTLIPLAFRPGQLTEDYLRGRQARFMPPFRMYLVLSLVFFLVAFFDPREDLGILFAPEPADGTPALEDVRDTEAVGVAPDGQDTDDDGISVTIDGDGDGDGARGDSSCEFDDYNANDMPRWLARRLTRERLVLVCRNLVAEDGKGMKGFLDKLSENVPVGLFVLLPMMALVLKLLYPLSKRYYVEHLLFVVHYHAFIFLILILHSTFVRIGDLARLPGFVDAAVGFAVSLYIPVYLYKSQRRVYRQGRFFTTVKLFILLIAYATGLSLIIGIAALFAAFSV